jgi:hypothetical protein
MFKRPLVKPLLGAAALIASTAAFTSLPAKADPASCSGYARDIAASEAPRRGLIDGVVIGTLDTVFTGGAGADERYRDAYNEAYADCMNSQRVAYVQPRTSHVVVSIRPEVGSDEWLSYCSAKYRSFDPDSGTYVTYEGERLPCR